MNYLCFFYLSVWISLRNYIIFNLFTLVLLQSFDDNEGDDEDDDDYNEIIEKMYTLPDYLYKKKRRCK